MEYHRRQCALKHYLLAHEGGFDTVYGMADSIPPLSLQDRAQQLADPVERRLALQAFDDAANLPIELSLVTQIEDLYGNGAGLTDVHAYCVDHMTTHPVKNDFEALIRAAFLLRVCVAFRPESTPTGPLYRRFDLLEDEPPTTNACKAPQGF